MKSNSNSLSILYNFMAKNYEIPNSSFHMLISNAFGKLDNSLLSIDNSINGDTGFLSYLESIQQNMITNNTFNKFSSDLFKFLKKNVEDVQTHFIHNFLTENFNIQNASFSQFILNNFQEILFVISSINP
jgi:hypothetical protein